LQQADGGIQIVQQQTFGDFQLQRIGRQAAVIQTALHGRRQIIMAELAAGYIHRHPHVRIA
jgi:hypothetical protein